MRIASTLARSRCASAREAVFESHWPSPGGRVKRPSSESAAFAMTKGKPVTIHLLNATFSARHSASRTPVDDLEASRPQQFDSAARVCGIRINRANYHTGEAVTHDRFHTRRRAAMRRARFERHVKRRTMRETRLSQGSQGFDLRMRQPRATMKAARHDPPSADDDRADRRIRARLPESTAGFTQCGAHEFLIVHPHWFKPCAGALKLGFSSP